ncbi:MAG: glutamate--tRNA ligase [Chloroflexota bacterium]
MTDSRPVRVRFAPSPTGDLHIGGIRTALFNWLFARRYGGKFILRIEDTDQKRTKEESQAGILNGLAWAGLNWDEGPDIGGSYGPYIQSERVALYRQWVNWLVDKDLAYRAYETPDELAIIAKLHQGYDRRARELTRDDWARFDAEGKPFAVRFKIPLLGETTFTDMVRGPITFQNDKLQDVVLLKSDGFPTYHLANIVDDHFMEISHIIRAEEWIPSAPIHKLLYEAFNWEMPQIAHVPVILAPDGGKISKRKHPEAAISYFIKGGYLPEAVTNFLCNVGWNYGVLDAEGNEVQIFTKEQAAEIFDISRVTNNGTKFDLVKLQWLNGEHIRLMNPVELAKRLRQPLEDAGLTVDMDLLIRVTPLIQERIKLLNDIVELAGFFFRGEIKPITVTDLVPKKMTAPQTRSVLQQAYDRLAALPDFSHTSQEESLRPLAEELGLKPGPLFTAIRVAVTGQPVSPPLFETMEILGRELALARIAHAIQLLQ